jgi:hypothetical protein
MMAGKGLRASDAPAAGVLAHRAKKRTRFSAWTMRRLSKMSIGSDPKVDATFLVRSLT